MKVGDKVQILYHDEVMATATILAQRKPGYWEIKHDVSGKIICLPERDLRVISKT